VEGGFGAARSSDGRSEFGVGRHTFSGYKRIGTPSSVDFLPYSFHRS